MDFIVKGFIKKILPVAEGISQNGTAWARQTVVLEHESGQYPKSIAFDISGSERINSMAMGEGEEVTVHLNINTREYNGKIFNSIECWKVERPGQQQGQQAQAAPAPQAQAAPAPQAQQGGNNTQGNGPLPF